MIRSTAKFAGIGFALLSATGGLSQNNSFERDPSDPISSFAMKDAFGNEQQHLIKPAPQEGSLSNEGCMPGTRLCFSINNSNGNGQSVLRVRRINESRAQQTNSISELPLDLVAQRHTELRLWNMGIKRIAVDERDADGESLFIGVISNDRLTLSGGGASSQILWLYRIDNAGTAEAQAHQILSVPFGAGRSIRACFNTKDERLRHNACQDELEIVADLVLDPTNDNPMPRLNYSTGVRTYPSDIPLRAPEDLPERLTQADLIWKKNELCSYIRKLAWNPPTARYEFDKPAPDCSIYGMERL